jgi:hypothetical protein
LIKLHFQSQKEQSEISLNSLLSANTRKNLTLEIGKLFNFIVNFALL